MDGTIELKNIYHLHYLLKKNNTLIFITKTDNDYNHYEVYKGYYYYYLLNKNKQQKYCITPKNILLTLDKLKDNLIGYTKTYYITEKEKRINKTKELTLYYNSLIGKREKYARKGKKTRVTKMW